MNFWVISPNAQNDGNVVHWLKRTKDEGKVFIGYDENSRFGGMFFNSIDVDDCIIVARGAKDERTLYYAGLVTSDSQYDEESGGNCRNYDILIEERDFVAQDIYLDSENAGGNSRNPGTVYQLKDTTPADKVVMDKLTQLIKNKIMARSLQQNIDILKFKKQIILQGPPGTGKTKLAKDIAKKMVEPINLISSVNEIDSFFKNFNSSDADVIKNRQFHQQLLFDFQSRFPKDKLKELSLTTYSIGKGTNDSFCWWIERGLRPLGAYSPGRAWSYLIYWDKSIGDYSKHGALLRDVKSDQEAIEKIGAVLNDVISSKDPYLATAYFGDSFLLKILNSYYPDEFFPINGRTFLANALKLFGVDPAGMDKIQMNKRIVQLFNDKNKAFSKDVTPFELMHFFVDKYDMKGNIELQSNQVVVKGEYKLIQFHPAYTYEDFVRGIVAKTNNEGKVYYQVENKTLAEFARKALDSTSANFVLIIDEINRANLPAVLGELIYAMEYRFDKDNVDETSVESMYALLPDEEKEEGDDDTDSEIKESKVLRLPKNLYIIGTMNTADRSVGHIDYAIRRRFAFVDVLPKEIPELTENGKKLFQKVALLFCDKFEEENSDLKNSKYLAQDFKPTDVILGHSYFLIKEDERKTLGKTDDEILEMKLIYEILPLLREYVKDGILNKQAEQQFKHTLGEWLKL